MKICFVADLRSPTAQGWIDAISAAGHEVHVVSTRACRPDVLPGVVVHQLDRFPALGPPSAMTSTSSARSALATIRRGLMSPRLIDHSVAANALIGPVLAGRRASPLRGLLERLQPDLVHALRIPYEGIVAAGAVPAGVPLVVSVWGNDLTLHARQNPLVGAATRRTLRRADGLIADAQRDIRLAAEWGLAHHAPTRVLPGGGGIDLHRYTSGPVDETLRREWDIPGGARILVNPRGFRPRSVRHDVFFRAVATLDRPGVVFVCLGMAGHPAAERWVDELGIAELVRLVPGVPHDRMADVFRTAESTVSLSVHDGTPNSLLEAMACGCLPVAGGIESIREWVEDGVNGLLCDAANIDAVRAALRRAIDDGALRAAATGRNRDIVEKRAASGAVVRMAVTFYAEVVETAAARRRLGRTL